MDRITIYNLASVDVHTDSTPNRKDNGDFDPSNGQIQILNGEQYSDIWDIGIKLNNIESKITGFYKQMLQLAKPFEDDLVNTNNEKIIAKREKEELNAKTLLLEEAKEEEAKRLLVIGYPLPTFTKKKQTLEKKINRKKINWVKIFAIAKKWIGIGVFVFLFEGFLGLVQFDFLSDYKSNVDIALRIFASVFLIITLHWAEYKYKEKGAKQFKYYILFGMFMLCVNLFMPLVLNYFFQDSIVTVETNNSWDFSAEDLTTPISDESDISMVGFLNRFDFIPALIPILVFLLMLLLDKSAKRNENIEDHKEGLKPAPENATAIIFNRYNYLNNELVQERKKLQDLNSKITNLNTLSSNTILIIKAKLISIKNKIEELESTKSNILKKTDKKLAEVAAALKTYETDFNSIIKTEVKSQFIDPIFPNTEDLKKYYNLI